VRWVGPFPGRRKAAPTPTAMIRTTSAAITAWIAGPSTPYKRKTIAVQREGERGHGTEDYCDRDPDPRTEFQGAKPAANRYGRNGSLMATYKRKDAERADKNGSQNGHP